MELYYLAVVNSDNVASFPDLPGVKISYEEATLSAQLISALKDAIENKRTLVRPRIRTTAPKGGRIIKVKMPEDFADQLEEVYSRSAREAGTGTSNAMERLRSEHSYRIDWGKHVAIKIAMKQLTVHSREVRSELVRMGIIPDEGGGREFWLGAVIKELASEGALKWNGMFHQYSDETRNVHERTVKQWVIDDKAAADKYLTAPERKVFA